MRPHPIPVLQRSGASYLTSCAEVRDTVRQTIGTRVLEILQKKAPCQLNLGDDEIEEVIDDDGDDSEDDRNAELDAMLIDAAADVIGACAVAMGPEFVEYFRVFWPSISKYYVRDGPCAHSVR